jgi:hypothetical protein
LFVEFRLMLLLNGVSARQPTSSGNSLNSTETYVTVESRVAMTVFFL